MKRTFKCGICGEALPQTVEELESEFDNLRTKIEAMVLYERGMAEGLSAQIAEHERNAEKYLTLLTSVNEFAKVA